MAGAIAQDQESCQFPFVLDEKPTVVPVGSAGERWGGGGRNATGAAQSKSELAAPSAWGGKRFSDPQERAAARSGQTGNSSPRAKSRFAQEIASGIVGADFKPAPTKTSTHQIYFVTDKKDASTKDSQGSRLEIN